MVTTTERAAPVGAGTAQPTGAVDDWRVEYAYTAGVQTFIYGFPYVYNVQLRRDWVTNPRDPAFVPYA
jgi:hypothetical protein